MRCTNLRFTYFLWVLCL